MKKFTAYRHVLFLTLLVLIAPTTLVRAETTTAVYQLFEHGVMIWREDSGEVWAMYDVSWRTDHFIEADYANLSDNPVNDEAPNGLIKPHHTFGRIWGNKPTVRYGLGWAVAPEANYIADFNSAPPTAGGIPQIRLTMPDGRIRFLHADSTWQHPGPRPIPSLPATTIFPATYQPFQNGFMVYWSETGSIWVMTNDGQHHLFLSEEYGALPDNPIMDEPPPNHLKPVFGFGKVWGHFPQIREALGWATQPEQGYLMTFERSVSLAPINAGVIFIVSLPGGRQLWIYDTLHNWFIAP